jgi:hypothetical protein
MFMDARDRATARRTTQEEALLAMIDDATAHSEAHIGMAQALASVDPRRAASALRIAYAQRQLEQQIHQERYSLAMEDDALLVQIQALSVTVHHSLTALAGVQLPLMAKPVRKQAPAPEIEDEEEPEAPKAQEKPKGKKQGARFDTDFFPEPSPNGQN